MIKRKKFFNKGLILTVTLATLLTVSVQTQSVQAATSRTSKTTTQVTISEDQKAASAVDVLIQALPKLNKVTLNNETSINDANTAYNALTDVQKALVKRTNSTKLADEVKKIENLKQSTVVDALIEALPKTNKITLTDETNVNNAYTAYTALSKDQKILLNKSNIGKITSAVKQIARLKKLAANALAQINSGTEEFAAFAKAGVTGAVEVNKTAYDTAIANAKTTKGSDLTLAEVQSIIDSTNQSIIDLNAAQAVIDKISALDNTKDTYAADVEAAKEAYDGLTDVQKSLVTNYADLVTAEQAAGLV